MERELKSHEEESEQQGELVEPPEGAYFIHGVRTWSKNETIGIRSPEISGSLQVDGITKPIRPYGYRLRVDKGGLSSAFAEDVTSEFGDGYKKRLKRQSSGIKRRQYEEDELSELVDNTKIGSHNELWLIGNMIEIVGAYITEDGMSAPGAQAFLKACRKDGISIEIIKRKLTE